MPELPEVETVCRGLRPAMEGARIEAVDLRRADLRFPFPDRFAARLKDQTVNSLARRAKYLLAHLSGGETLIAHLGMSGSFRIEADGAAASPGAFHHERSKATAHDHVLFRLVHPDRGALRVIYNDPRRFGFMLMARTDALDTHASLAGLGLEPLGNSLSGPVLQKLFAGKSAPLKAALLDQRLIAGLGNIYVCEALWRSGLSPFASAGTLAEMPDKAELLSRSIRAVLEEAIEAGGSSLRDHRQADGTLGYFQHRFAVYDREGEACAHDGCHGAVERQAQAGRSTFFCPSCQRQGEPGKSGGKRR